MIKGIVLGVIVVTGMWILAAEPDWPDDFEAQVAARQAAWLPTSAVAYGAVPSSFDARMNGYAASAAYGSVEKPFDSWGASSDFAKGWIALITFPIRGLIISFR